MTIYTGYFAKLEYYKAKGLSPMAICRKRPSSYDGPYLDILAPTWEILTEWKRHYLNKSEYIARFQVDVLDKIEGYYKDQLKEFFIKNDGGIILLCYERSGEFCHRHLVARWIKKELGIDCVEYS